MWTRREGDHGEDPAYTRESSKWDRTRNRNANITGPRAQDARYRAGPSRWYNKPSHHNNNSSYRTATNNQRQAEGTLQIEKTIKKEAETLKEAQDQLYRRALLTQADDEQWPSIVGSCPDMCPASEREYRSRLRDLAVFERLDNDQSRTSKDLAVKKFCRTFTGKDLKQSDIRPLPVLSYTMDHLMKTLDNRNCVFDVVHDFLFDRTRAVRQELSMQRITDKKAITILENIVRFHIVSERELRQQRVSGKAFDSHLNLQQLTKALVNLLNLYITNGSNDVVGNEAEFSCYYVLLNLNQAQQLSLWFKGARPELLRKNDMQFARNILRCYQQNNFCRFFRMVKDATYLQCCLLELYINEVRAYALNAINHGAYKLHPYPVNDLAELLLMETEDVEEFCVVHGLAVGTSPTDEVQLLVKQAEFTVPKQGTRQYHCKLIQDKHPLSLGQVCCSITPML